MLTKSKLSLDKAFESFHRLKIMLILIKDEVDFNFLKKATGISDGNLGSHLKELEKPGYIVVNKQFEGRRPKTTYLVTKKGREAFNSHLEELRRLIG